MNAWLEVLRRTTQRTEARIASACARSGRSLGAVRLVCVTKQRPLEALQALFELGYRDFGENRVQELRERAGGLPPTVRWHLIGPLQTNKAKYLPGVVSCVHSIDRPEAAQALQRALEKAGIDSLPVLLQLNISGEEQKHGQGELEARAFLEKVAGECPLLRVDGLMTMAPYGETPELARPVFRRLRQVRDELVQATGLLLPELSMGMTGDFEVAIEEGATMIRVGTALFEEAEP
jgi:PLP dependent protein